MDKVNHPKRIASDKNNYIIAMWRYLVDYKYDFPIEISKDEYAHYRTLFNERGFVGEGDTLDEAMIGWIGGVASVNGKFYNGAYCRNACGRDYVREHINNILEQKDKLTGVRFIAGEYDEIEIPYNSVIYCDPPYQNTCKYTVSRDFDYNAFWEWCRLNTDCGNDVLISEYTAPNDFIPIWQMEIKNSMHQTITYKPIEKLFVHESIVEKYKTRTLYA